MVISGESKGQKGRVLNVDRAKERAIVEGVNTVSKHTKPNAKSPREVLSGKKPRFTFRTSCSLIRLQESLPGSAEGSMIKIN